MSHDGSTLAGTMRAVRIEPDRSITVVEVPTPPFAADEILVRPVACGICGTDLHILEEGFPGTHYPCTPGHEFAGHVVATGGDVEGVKEGDFVAVDPNVVCGACRWCRVGRPNLCPQLSPIGVGRAGAAAEVVAAPVRNAVVVQERIGHEVAALIEPLACVLNAIRAAGPIEDRRVAVLGAGTMGLLTAIVCNALGNRDVTVADPVSAKHEVVRAVGIDRAVAPDALKGEKFDIVFEAAGAMPALRHALNLVDKTGTLVQVGVHHEHATVEINPFRIYEHELRIVGSNSCADQFPAAAELMPDIRDRARRLVSTTFPVWDFAAAARHMKAGAAIKTQLSFA